MEEPGEAPREPTFERLDEMADTVADYLRDDDYLQVIWPLLAEHERTSLIRTFSLMLLLFERGGHQRLLDKLHTDFPQLQTYEDEVDTLATAAWLMGAATALRYLRRTPPTP
jgi:hypothetical protein